VLKANPGSCFEELLPPVPERNPLRIANTQTTIAVIQVIRTAARPANLISGALFTMTGVWRPTEFWGYGILPWMAPGGGQMTTPRLFRFP